MVKNFLKIVLLTIFIVSVMTGCGCEHEWIEATCEEPKICAKCNVTEGEALGHIWMEATCNEAKACTRCGITEGVALGHTWKDATCTEPKTCQICGITEGEVLEHTWEEATCEKAKTCTVCGITDGEPLGHSFGKGIVTVAATCTKEGNKTETCSLCGFERNVKISKLDHQPGEWITEKEPTSTEKGIKKKYCIVCGTEVASEKIEIDEGKKESLYKNECQKVSYIDLARTPDAFKGEKIKVGGEVIQVIEAQSKDYYCVYLVNITKNGDYYTYYDDTVWVEFDGYGLSTRVLEDDIITIYGEYKGLTSYTTVLGATRTVPRITAKYIEFK